MNWTKIRTRVAWATFFVGCVPAAALLLLGLLTLALAVVVLVVCIVLAAFCLTVGVFIAPGRKLEYKNHYMEVSNGPWLYFE